MIAGPVPAHWASALLSVARIFFGFLLLRHGMEQVIGFPNAWVQADHTSFYGILKLLAFPGGMLLMLGLYTRLVAIVLSIGFLVYWFVGPLPAFLVEGRRLMGARGPSDPVVLNGLFLLYVFAAGPGVLSLDRLRQGEAALAQKSWAPKALGVLRIAAGFLFIHHGIEKWFGGRVPLQIVSLRALAGTLELTGGPLMMLGLFTRPLTFLLSGEMAFAYFINHSPEGFWGSFIEPNQEAAILNCFLFLFLSAAGGGSWSLDRLWQRRRERRVSIMGVQSVARLVVISTLFLPAAAWAQSSITGTVRDSSGGVLPGVTVEASSPALIDKVRTGVTDAQGLYRIVDLRPGVYSVTFTLPGFTTYRREGLELRAEFNATVNAEMAVGALQETVTVTGEAPLVDIRSSREQAQIEQATLEALPGAGRLTTLAAIIPSATLTQEFNRGVGGTSDRTHTRYSVHGAPEAQPYMDGMNQQLPNSTQGVVVFNQLALQEVVVETSGIGADRDSGGMTINMIPRDGGNAFSGSAIFAYSGPDLETKNVTDELLARGLNPQRVGSLKKFRDSGAALGGPIRRDRLWFFTAVREGVAQQYADGVYWNKLRQPQSLLYEPDLSRGPANTNDYSKDLTFRFTWQAAQKHKIVAASSFQDNCNCVFNLLSTGTQVTPEAAGPHTYNPNYLPSVTWTYPATSRVLFEAGASVQMLFQRDTREEGWDHTWYRITDQALNLTYGNVATRTIPRRQLQQRVAMSYVTGSHQFKTGINVKLGKQGNIEKLGFDRLIHGTAVDYRFNNGVPNQLTLLDAPWNFEETVNDIALYVQDAWTRGRMTLNLGVRYNEVRGSTPEQVLGEGFFVPERRFEALDNVPQYRNLSPRLGVAYDLFGTGRTALKASIGHYPEIVRVVTGNPANNLVRNTNRTWNDANRNYVPDCDLRNPVANGECGPWSNLNFGRVSGATRYADGSLDGFNSQYHNWQGAVSLQHELTARIGVSAGYYRTWYGGDCGGSGLTNTVTCTLVTDNLRVAPADFDEFCITAPSDPRLPGGGGARMCGLFDLRPALFGQTDNLARPASDFGTISKVYNGFDVTVNARFGQGGVVSGGLSAGRTVEDNCVVVDSPQAARDGFCRITPPWSAGTQAKFMVVYPLPFDIQTSAIYQNSPGIPIAANLVVANAAIAPSLGRNLSACPATTGACNANVTVPLIPDKSVFESRLQQVDLRFSRAFRFGSTRVVRANLDVYNVLNASNVLNMNTTYGAAWKTPTQILSGRLLRVGAQFDF
jgi:putative oxidoreductase